MDQHETIHGDDRVAGSVAVITGAGAGIGRGIARRLGAAGAGVVVADFDAARGTAVAEEIAAAGGAAIDCATDVRDPAGVDALVERALERFGRIDLLVNSAGVVAVEPFLDASLDAWRNVFAVNVEGALLVTQRVAAAMLRQDPEPRTACRGKIVNVSSAAAEVGRPFLPAYGASKAALNHLSKTAAAVLAEHDVPVTVLYPGNVADGMWDRLGVLIAAAEGKEAEDVVRERMAITPAGRFQTADEVAELALFVAAYVGMGLNGRILWTEPHVTEL
jgi:NAD(P)-dependent dehydrogenase (short-subunit alcohol dehydrogenase family)